MIVASADLSNSDKTDGFLKKTKAFTKGDFSGRFLAGRACRELTMACIMNGMALHGGVIPACGTFFVFSDYMKPAVRLSALMRLHGELYLDARLVPRRRGRPDAPADRARGADPPDGAPAQPRGRALGGRAASRRRRGDGRRMAVSLIEEQTPRRRSSSRARTSRTCPPLAASRREEADTARQGRLHRRRLRANARRSDGRLRAVRRWRRSSKVPSLLKAQEGIKARIVSRSRAEGLFRDQPQSYQQSRYCPAGIRTLRHDVGAARDACRGSSAEKGFIARPRPCSASRLPTRRARQGVRLQRRDRRRRSQETVGTRIARFTARNSAGVRIYRTPALFFAGSRIQDGTRAELASETIHTKFPTTLRFTAPSDAERIPASTKVIRQLFRRLSPPTRRNGATPANARTDPQKQRPQPESCGRKKHSTANGINRNSAKRCPDVPSCTRSEATCRTSCRTSPP